MNAITAPLRELAEFEEGQALLKNRKPASALQAAWIPRSFIWPMDSAMVFDIKSSLLSVI